jgi:hypothetical protein
MRLTVAFALAALNALPSWILAQELEPRAYSASPIGANFAGAGYVYSTGGVLFDPSLPVSDVHAYINGVSLGYGHTFGLGGMQGLITASLPYAWGLLTGKVGPSMVDSSITRTGFGDLRTKISLNFIGSPALSPQEFATRQAQPILFGASLLIVAPTGAYNSHHLINIGSNRFAFKPELGFSYNFDRKLYLDLYGGVWFFAQNMQFYPDNSTLSESPLLSTQLHVSYTFNKQFWAAIESTWYAGGEDSVNGGPATGRQDNTRLGFLLVYNLTSAHSIKASFNKGAFATLGQNFSTYSLAYQYLWF